MKVFLKIFLTGIFAIAVLSVNAQYRHFYPGQHRYHHDQPNIGRNGELKQDRQVYRNRNSKLLLNLNYGISLPLGSLRDYADKTSFNGWNASVLYQINPKIALGLGVGFYDYYYKIPRKIYQDGSTTISAVQTHTLQLIPIQPTFLYTPHGDKPGIHPYIGLGVGITDVNYEKYWGVFSDKYNKIAFSVSPMAGIHIPLGHSPVKVNIGVKYNYVPYSHNEISNISTVEGNIGISWNLR